MDTIKRFVPYILYVAIVIGLIVAIVFTFHGKDDKPVSKQLGSNTAQQQKQPAQQQPAKPAQPTQPQSPSSTQTNQQPATTNSQLSNTGPGTTIALFAAVASSGVVGYQVYLRRKHTA